MATQNPQIVPNAFKSQQPPFYQGGSQVPITLIDLTMSQSVQPKKKQKINHYFKKRVEVIDLVSDSSSDDEIPPPHIRNFSYGRKKPPAIFKDY